MEEYQHDSSMPDSFADQGDLRNGRSRRRRGGPAPLELIARFRVPPAVDARRQHFPISRMAEVLEVAVWEMVPG